MSNYRAEAQEDALTTVGEYTDEIIEMLCDDGKASDDLLNDYGSGDSYHHESHVDRDYDLTEAAECLDQLNEYEETDSGLWEGLEPRRAIAAQAAYTYGNAVYSFWRDLIEELNEDFSDLELPEENDELADEDNEEAKKAAVTAFVKQWIKAKGAA